MKAIDLFCGAGGASLGLRAAGLELVGAFDIDARAVAMHRKLLPDCPAHVADVNLLDSLDLPAADVWWASPPCQPFSTAGKRLGKLDSRNGYPALLRLLRDPFLPSPPKWLIVENVPGLVFHRKGCDADPAGCPGCYFDEVHGQLKTLMRCDLPIVGVLDAAAFGVPQHRKRLICIYGPNAHRLWIELTHGPYGALPYVSAGEALGLREGTIETGQNSGGIPGNPHRVSVDEPSPAVRASRSSMWLSVGGPNARDGRGPLFSGLEEPAPTVRTHADVYLVQAGLRPDGSPCADVKPRTLDEPAASMTGKATTQLVRREDGRYVRLRTLNVRERAKLQSLPWADGLTGKMIGNAVPPPMAEAIARAVLAAEDRA